MTSGSTKFLIVGVFLLAMIGGGAAEDAGVSAISHPPDCYKPSQRRISLYPTHVQVERKIAARVRFGIPGERWR